MAKIIHIKGGLGNQLFQYAYGRKLEIIDKKEIIFDTSFFNNIGKDTKRPFLLDKFNINPKANFQNIPQNIFSKIKDKVLLHIIRDYSFYQNEKYFINIKETILKEFTLKETLQQKAEEIKNKILSTNSSISIHFRRGDYVNNPKTNKHHGETSLDYYNKAIEYMARKVENPVYFVFSDDIEWVKENFKFENATHVSSLNLESYEEMYLMSLCSSNIIANSTFSWWGAYLSPNQGKIIIAPKEWTQEKTSDELGILPKNWVQL